MALSNIKKADLGGGLQLICGDYTHTEGAAAESLVVAAGRCYFAHLGNQDSGSDYEATPSRVSVSLSGRLLTITFNTQSNVTVGRFVVLVGN